MSAPAITAAAKRRQAMLLRRRSRRPGPVLDEELTTLAALAARKQRRTSPPVTWPGVGRFSDDADKLSDVEVVRLAKRCHLLDELREETDFTVDWGRPRDPGEAALAYLAFIHSGRVDIQPWWRSTYPELWFECGFAGKPRYELVRDRFIELEQLGTEAFFRASAKLIRHAQEMSAGMVGFDLSIDCTEATTHARLHHDCQEGEDCPGQKFKKRNRHGIKTNKPGDALAAKADTDKIKRKRQKINRDDFDPNADVAGDVETKYYDEARGVFRVKLGGHWWRCRDATAGVRAITGKRGGAKAWTGFYSLKLVCRTFNTPIVHIFEAADMQEHFLFDEALERALYILGEKHIRSIGFDAGFAVKDVYAQCAQHGITGVGPFRRHRLTKEQERLGLTETDRPRDHDAYDRDGIPRCKYCGGETKFIKFLPGAGRVWFSCARPGPECRKDKTDKKTGATRSVAREQALSLSQVDPRYVLPLWRNTAAYQALRELGIAYERAHALSAVRSKVGTKDYLSRPKRIGVECQQLRATASAVTDWLQVLFRQGWLPQTILRGDDPFAYDPPEDPRDLPVTRALRSSSWDWHGKDIRTNELGEEYVFSDRLNPEQPYTIDGSAYVKQMNAERRREGLHRPYGKPAVKLGLGPLRPEKREGGYASLDTNELATEYVDPETGEVLTADQAELTSAPVVPIERARHAAQHRAEANAPPPANPPPTWPASGEPGIYGQPLDEPAGPS